MDPLADMPQPVAFKPRLPALRLDAGPRPAALAAWCPYCEGLHHHGGRPGPRARHCEPGSGMPFAGYELTEGHAGQRPSDALPAGLFVAAGRTLRAACEDRGAELRRALALVLLDLRGPHGRRLGWTGARGAVDLTVADRTGCGSAHRALPADDWTLTAPGGRERPGRGLLDLAGALFGVPAAVVALRAVEAVLGLRLDAQAAAGLCAVVAAWDARGRPGPEAGPWPRA